MTQKLWTAAAALIIITTTALITAHLTGHEAPATEHIPAAADLTRAQAQAALLDSTDLPGWAPAPAQGNSRSSFDIEPAACGRAVTALDAVSSQWDDSPARAETSFEVATPAGTRARLKEEIAHDSDLEPRELVEHLANLLESCPTYVFSLDGVDYPGTIRSRDFNQGETGVGLAQTWSLPASAGGGAMTVRFAYLVQGHSIAVLTLTTTDPTVVSDADFSAVVRTAAHKLAEVTR